jgi:signal transduction histidine kinase
VESKHLPDSGQSIDAALRAWQAKAMDLFLIVNCIAMIPMLAAYATTPYLPANLRAFRIAVGVTIGLVTLLRGVDHRIRGWILGTVMYANAAASLAAFGMAGTGRVILVTTPIWVLVLLGRASGWVAAGLSLAIYLSFTVAAELNLIPGMIILQENPAAADFWVLQGLVLLFALVPVLVLVERFAQFQFRTLQSERIASSALEQEVVRRTAANQALKHEMARRRRLEREITQVSDQERRHFGSEIHDGLCQQLTAALLNCAVLEKDLDREGSSAAPRAGTLRELLQESIDDAYDIAKGLCPVDLAPDALVPALERMTARIRTIFDVDCRLELEGDVTLPSSENAFHLHRIAMEAVNNAVRHAGAHCIVVALRGRQDDIFLAIRDDGRGMDSPGPESRGMGLRIMAYRAHMMGGKLAITPAPGCGTIVSCRVPRESKGPRKEEDHD